MNEHVHFHCRVIDDVFEPVVAPDEAPSVSFHAALELNAAAIADMQARGERMSCAPSSGAA